MSKRNAEEGFSLIELLLVCVIIGIIAAVAVPAFQKATKAAENASAFQMMRILYSTQANFFSQRGRFGRLQEIHPSLNNQGTLVVDKIFRGKHTFEMTPATDDELRSDFTIRATRSNAADTILDTYELDSSGTIMKIFP